MICPNCSFVNPDGMRFCGSCGSLLVTPKTGDELAPEPIPPQLVSKILSQVKTLEGERRKVTVLFADISGYTSMSEKMDPEDLANFANEAFRRLGRVIYEYEGTIDKYMGDCVMAIFGAPVAHENDPERALRASLEMMREVKQLSQSISLHVGVNSGEVVAGKIGSDLKMDYTVMGDTVNLAERLTGAAHPGEIYVSATTYRLTRHTFDFEELSPLTLKGKREKTRAYKLTGVREEPGRARGVPGLTPQFLGRDNELHTLRQSLDRVREGSSHTVFVLGEAGVGKSRLIDEFKKSSREHATWLEGRCSSYATTDQFFPFAQLLESALLNNSSTDEPDQTGGALKKIKTLFPERWVDVATSIARILPFEIESNVEDTTRYLDPRTLRVRTFVAVRDLLEALSETKPLVVAIDDIHWADESSQDLMQFLIETTSESPIMIIGATRPTPGSKWEQIQKDAIQKLPARTESIDLKRLSREEMEELIDLLLEKPSINKDTRLGILEKSGGSPFFLEEIIKNLIEAEVLSKRKNRWVCDVDSRQVPIPETVEAVIASRIDKLPPRAISLVRSASVFGTKFTYDDLMCVAAPADALKNELAELLRSGIMLGPTLEKGEYCFAHPLIQEVAHASILKGSRKGLHLRAARCIEKNYSRSLDHYFGVLGMHYETGGNLPKAFLNYFAAGKKAKESYANREAITNFTKALAIEPAGDADRERIRERISAMIDRAKVYRLTGETELALADLTHALSLSRREGETKYVATCLIGLSQTYGYTSRLREVEEASKEALELSKQLNDRDVESASLDELGYARQMSGRYDEAISFYKKSLDISTATDNKLAQSTSLNNLGAAYCSQGDLKRGLEHFEESLKIKRDICDLEGEAANLHNLGYIQFTLGNNSQALSFYRASLRLKERIGDRAGAGVTMNSLGAVFMRMGEYEKGLGYCRRALQAREEVGDKRGQGYTLHNMSRILTMTGPVEETMDVLRRSLMIMEEVNDREGEALVLVSLGAVCTDDKRHDEALEYLTKAETIAAEIGASRAQRKARSELALRALLCSAEDAENIVTKVASEIDESSDPETRAICSWLQAGINARKRDIVGAVNKASLARTAAEEGVDLALAARWMFHISGLLETAGAHTEAKEHLLASESAFRELDARLWLDRLEARSS